MLRGIKLGIAITPAVIFFLRDLACLQLVGSLLPSAEHFVQAGSILVFANLYPQADFAVDFAHAKTVSVFQGEERVHQPGVGINVGYSQSLRRYIEDIGKCGGLAIVICTVAAAVLAAVLFPVEEAES